MLSCRGMLFVTWVNRPLGSDILEAATMTSQPQDGICAFKYSLVMRHIWMISMAT